ncbi:MAG TPA: hypothetical protein VMN82_02820 [Thermoanaerobaculia bacterium]|nr:hypothetical protein [Thermoanaerobaculia bacterium]
MPTAAWYRDLSEAEVASATLEAAGIFNFLTDAWTIGVDWAYSTALGGIRLGVRAADLEEAREILASVAEAEWPADLPPPSEDERCLACGAASVRYDSGPRRTLTVMTAFGFPLWLWRSRWRCGACGASRVVPLRFRPDLLIAWLLIGVAVMMALAMVDLVVGYVFLGRRAS